jgi:hypothetical protein
LKTLNITMLLTTLFTITLVSIPISSEAKTLRPQYQCYYEHKIVKNNGEERSKYEITVDVVAPFLCPAPPPDVIKDIHGEAAFVAHLTEGDSNQVVDPDDIKCLHIAHPPTIVTPGT